VKAFFANFLGFLRHHAWGITLSLAMISVVWFSVVLVLNLQVGFRSKPDRIVGSAVERAAKAETLSEVKQTIRSLEDLRQRHMMPATRGRLLLALANLHRDHAEIDSTGHEETHHLDCAQRFYSKAQALLPNPEDLYACHYGMAYVAYLRHDWTTAMNGFARLQRQDPHRENWTALELLRCTCLLKLGEIEQTYLGLRGIFRRYTGGPTHDEASMRLAELMIAERRRRDSSATADDTPKPAGQIAAMGTDELTQQARRILGTELENAGPDNVRRLRVLNDLLELCILTGDVDEAYRHVRELEAITDHHELQIRSYSLLATLEESQGNPLAAENALRFCLKEFPDHRKCHAVRLRLYRLLKDHGKLDEALDVFDSMIRTTDAREWIREFTDELLPGNEASIIHSFQDPEATAKGIARLLRIADALKQKTPARWLEIRERLLYAKAALLYRSGDYAATQDQIIRYLATTPYREYIETLLAMDADCAVKLGLGPAIRATRAHRYLARYPEGTSSQAMLEHLLRAYYEMQLYQENLALAKAAFVHVMIGADNPSSTPLRLPVLQTTRWIAQSDTRLGKPAVAMPLFQRVSRRMDDFDLDLDFFRDWSQAAAGVGQARESIRRLQVGALRLPAGQDQDFLRTAVLDARFRAGEPGIVPQLETRVAQLRQQGTPADKDLLQPLLRDLLQDYLQNSPAKMPVLLAELVAKDPQAIWPSAWALRYLRNTLADKGRQPARQGLDEIYANTPPPQHVADCLRYLDTIADLDKRVGELHDRGL
jgi:tetratricopeptide (TPR) repeat protein/lambda repressor-like predicted transcriptional regulator